MKYLCAFALPLRVVPAMFPVPKVRENYDEKGNPIDIAPVEKRAKTFVGELIWSMEPKKRMEEERREKGT